MIDIQKHIEELTRKHHLAAEELTEKQFVEALRQAIAAGDFVRFVTQDGTRQGVVYIPFRECERLKTRIEKLEKLLKEKGIDEATGEE